METVEILLAVGLLWLVLLTLTNPMLWFAWIKFRAWLRMPRMRRELISQGRNPDKPFKMKMRVRRMRGNKEVY